MLLFNKYCIKFAWLLSLEWTEWRMLLITFTDNAFRTILYRPLNINVRVKRIDSELLLRIVWRRTLVDDMGPFFSEALHTYLFWIFILFSFLTEEFTWNPCRKPSGIQKQFLDFPSRYTPCHFPNVLDPGRISTATSKISPEITETSFPIPFCAWRPRITPYFEYEWLSLILNFVKLMKIIQAW